MKKEKAVKSYTRKTKGGKTTTVKAHSRKIESAEDMAKQALLAKKGAGGELANKKAEELKAIEEYLNSFDAENIREFMGEMLDDSSAQGASMKKLAMLIYKDKKTAKFLKDTHNEFAAEYNLPLIKSEKEAKVKTSKTASSKTAPTSSVSSDEYKAWYHWDQDADPKNEQAMKVEKCLKKKMGTKAYNKYFDEMSDKYTARGHTKNYKSLELPESKGKKSVSEMTTKEKLDRGIKPTLPKGKKDTANKVAEVKAYLDSFKGADKKIHREMIIDMLQDGMREGKPTNKTLAEDIVAEGKDLKFLQKSDKKFAAQYGLGGMNSPKPKNTGAFGKGLLGKTYGADDTEMYYDHMSKSDIVRGKVKEKLEKRMFEDSAKLKSQGITHYTITGTGTGHPMITTTKPKGKSGDFGEVWEEVKATSTKKAGTPKTAPTVRAFKAEFAKAFPHVTVSDNVIRQYQKKNKGKRTSVNSFYDHVLSQGLADDVQE